MKIKKIISVVCAAALFSAAVHLPVVAENTAAPMAPEIAYHFNDEFGAVTSTDNSGFDGWVFTGTVADSTVTFATTEPEFESSENYVLKYKSASNGDSFKTYVTKALESPMPFEAGKDVIIEAKFKQTESGRLLFKYNLVRDGAWEEYDRSLGTYLVNQNGKVTVPNGYRSRYMDSLDLVSEGMTNKWYTVQITVHGTSKTASYVLKDLSTNQVYTVNNANIAQPDGVTWVEDVLNSLELTLRDAQTLYVDYVKMYREADVVMSTEARYAFDDNITVNFSNPYNKYHKILKLVDSQGNEVETQNSIAADGKKITINPVSDLVPGETYKVLLDTTLSPLNYTFENSEVSFSVLTVRPPKAENIEITGRVINGGTIVADYDYICDASEGPSVYEWYIADSADGEWTKLDNELFKELEITDETFGKYIKFKVTPYATLEDGEPLDGEGGESNIIAPERAPVAEGLTLSADIPYIDSYLTAEYTYSDENGDEESGTEVVWYEGDTVDGGWSQFAEGKSCYITEEQYNKYIKCVVIPKNDADVYPSGTPVEIISAGSVTDIITATNKFINGGLETGELSPWYKKSTANVSADYKGITLVTDEEGVYSGSYALRSHPRINANTNDVYMQKVTLEKDRMYIVSGMVKSATDLEYINVEPYVHLGADGQTRPYRSKEYTKVGPEWTRTTLSFIGLIDGEYPIGWLSFSSPDADLYVDDAYLGELLISDIKTNEIAPVTIPKIGEKAIAVPVLTTKDGIMLNQFGETDGLTDQKAIVSVDGANGISVKENVIYIDDNASAGIYTVTVKCIPDFNLISNETGTPQSVSATPAQSEFVKTLNLELVAHDEKAPVAKNVSASGVVKTGNTLTGLYDFYQVDNKDEASEVKWMYSDSANGTYNSIPGATSQTYVVESEYEDKYIKFAVTPKTADGIAGKTVLSDWLLKPTAPVAKNVTISGDFKVGGTVTAKYEFYDANKDNEGSSIIKWYKAESKNGTYTLIPGQTGNTLVLAESLTDKYIKAGVTPVAYDDAIEPKTGSEVLSIAYAGPTAPVAKDVKITYNNNTLTGEYTYFHEHGAQEKGTAYKWTIDGTVVSTKSSYVVDFVGTKVVTFTVTPKGDTNPSTGKSVTVSATVTGKSGNAGNSGGGSYGGGFAGGGSSGGSSGGGASSSGGGIGSSSGVGITSINTMIPQEVTSVSGDIAGHWGADYITEMANRGVMSADENGNFEPDKIVSRQDMLTYLFKALKLEASDYSGMFEDVADGEFAGMLQTMVDNGTISADTTFRPGDSISREEMCKILYISLENAGKLGDVEETLINNFKDFGEIDGWAVKYVNAIYGNKIMIGVSDERFAPKENLTKAQAATLLVRILKLTEEAE